MLVKLRTYRFVPALLAVVLLLGVGTPLVQHVCALPGGAPVAEASAPDGRTHGDHAHAAGHTPAAAAHEPCSTTSAGDCAKLAPTCCEVQARSTDETPALVQRGEHDPAQLALPLVATLASLTPTAVEAGRRAPPLLEDKAPSGVPARLLFAVLLL